MRRFAGSGWMGLVVLSISGSAASAARAESIDGRVRLGLEAGLLEHRVDTTEANPGGSFGLPAVEQERTQTAVGFASTPFGPLFGYGISDSVYIGAQATIANQNEKIDGLYSTDVLRLGLFGTVAYVVDAGDVRPFFGPVIGYTLAKSSTDQDVPAFPGATTLSYSYGEHLFNIGAQAGLFGFVTSSVSIDPSVVFLYGTGGVTEDQSGGGASPSSTDTDTSGFSIGLRVSVSAWLGGGNRRADTGPERDLDAPSYAPPGDGGWNQPNPNYAPPSQQPAYPQSPPVDPGQPAYQPPPAQQQPPAYAPPAYAPPAYAPPGAAPPPAAPPPAAPPPAAPPPAAPSGARPPSQAFPAQ